MSLAVRSRVRVLVPSLIALPFASAVAAPQQATLRNTFLDRAAPYPGLSTQEPGRAFFVSEEAQGGLDLNGDGDAKDKVLHLLPQSSGALLALGLASEDEGPVQVGNTVALAVSEKAQGGAQLNGDNDTLDRVLHLVDATTGAITNTGLAIGNQVLGNGKYRLGEDYVALAVYENAQGIKDLNGDGDALDTVLHVIELATGIVTNYGLAVGDFELEGGVVAATVSEAAQNQDLNGDGDLSDFVPHVVDLASGSVHNLGVAGVWSGGGATISAGYVAYTQSEDFAGVDLNGDGDLADYVVQLVDAASGGVLSTGLATQGKVWFEGPYLVVAVSESQQGVDLNGDGDDDDRVPFIRHVPTGAVTNTGLAASEIGGLYGRQLTLHVSETMQGGVDLNGDGDTGDSVLHVMNLATGAVSNVGLHVYKSFPSRRLIGFQVREGLQGAQDLNGDGDASDLVWHAYDAWTGTTTNLGVATFDLNALALAEDDFLVCVAQEFFSGQQDFNGDGDVDDEVVFVLRAGASPQNMGVAVSASPLEKSLSNSGKRVLVPVSEADQDGQDLNGDGDTLDHVLHVLDVP